MINKINEEIYNYIFSINAELRYNNGLNVKELEKELDSLILKKYDIGADFWEENGMDFNTNCVTKVQTLDMQWCCMKDWNVLKNRKIINLIIGDSIIKEDFLFQFKMPYMTGNDIHEFAKTLGKDVFSITNSSRWMYMSELIEYVIENNSVNLFFKKLFNLRRFRKIDIPDYCIYNANRVYWDTLHVFFNKANEELFYDECHIEYDTKTWDFSLVDDGEVKYFTPSKFGKEYSKEEL